jgi:hypothetical protein
MKTASEVGVLDVRDGGGGLQKVLEPAQLDELKRRFFTTGQAGVLMSK